jgi:hypothetical protein
LIKANLVSSVQRKQNSRRTIPKKDGPLTTELLNEITQRECYQQMGFTPLIVAAYVEEETLARALVTEGADPFQPDINGRSAIWWSRRGWQPDKIVSMDFFFCSRLTLRSQLCSVTMWYRKGRKN